MPGILPLHPHMPQRHLLLAAHGVRRAAAGRRRHHGVALERDNALHGQGPRVHGRAEHDHVAPAHVLGGAPHPDQHGVFAQTGVDVRVQEGVHGRAGDEHELQDVGLQEPDDGGVAEEGEEGGEGEAD